MKTIVETVKTVTIVALVAGAIGFYVGTQYEKGNSERIQSAAKALTPTAQAQGPK